MSYSRSALRVCSQYWAPVIRVTMAASQKRAWAASANQERIAASSDRLKAPQAATIKA